MLWEEVVSLQDSGDKIMELYDINTKFIFLMFMHFIVNDLKSILRKSNRS